MYHWILVGVLAITTFAQDVNGGWLDDVVGIPACAKGCAKSLPAGCTNSLGVVDPNCVCKNNAWMNAAQCCINANCNNADGLITQQFAAQLCHYVGQAVPSPTNCPKPTTMATSIPTPVPVKLGYGNLNRYVYQGCYKPDSNGVVVYGSRYVDSKRMTQTLCWQLCNTAGSPFMGVNNGDTCFCGGNDNTLAKATKQKDNSLCMTKCNGYEFQVCGGNNYQAVWKTQ